MEDIDAPLAQIETNAGHDVEKKSDMSFSFKPHDVSAKSSIPSYSRGVGVKTQSQHLSENNGSIRRPSPFFMSSQQNPPQRSHVTDPLKSQRKLLSGLNFAVKNEERTPTISRNFDTAPAQAHRSFFSGIIRPPPLSVTKQPLSSPSVDQLVRPFSAESVMSDDYALPKPPAVQENQGAESTRTLL